jgi:hypothetical protein
MYIVLAAHSSDMAKLQFCPGKQLGPVSCVLYSEPCPLPQYEQRSCVLPKAGYHYGRSGVSAVAASCLSPSLVELWGESCLLSLLACKACIIVHESFCHGFEKCAQCTCTKFDLATSAIVRLLRHIAREHSNCYPVLHASHRGCRRRRAHVTLLVASVIETSLSGGYAG